LAAIVEVTMEYLADQHPGTRSKRCNSRLISDFWPRRKCAALCRAQLLQPRAACRLFPLGEALPSTTSAGSCLPLFGRLPGTTTSSDFSLAYMLGVLPSGAAGETSQVPRKELLHVHKVSDCARFTHASRLPWSDVAFPSAERDRHLGIGHPFRSSILGPWFPLRTLHGCPRGQNLVLGVGVVG
jgi:hypothetical protein